MSIEISTKQRTTAVYVNARSVKGKQQFSARVTAADLRTWAFASIVIAFATSAFAATQLPAQSRRVGNIARVRGVSAQSECDKAHALNAPPSAVSVIRNQVSFVATPPDSALVLDQLHVVPLADMQFEIGTSRFGDGIFTFTPALGRCTEAARSLRINGLTPLPGAAGSYSLSSRSERVGRSNVDRLLLTVDNGAVVVQWAHGLLSVYALGREIRDSGTVFMIAVDSVNNRAMMLVRDGFVTMAGVSNFVARAGDAFTFGRTGGPIPVTGSVAPIINEITFHSKRIWEGSLPPAGAPPSSGSGWKKAAKIVLGTAIIGGGGYAIYHAVHKNNSNSNSGNILVYIPL